MKKGRTCACVFILFGSNIVPVFAAVVAYPKDTACTDENTVVVRGTYINRRYLTCHPLAAVTGSPGLALVYCTEYKACLGTAIEHIGVGA